MTYYGKFIPYLQLSTLPDRSNNILRSLGSEEFTATKSLTREGQTIVPNNTNTAGHAYIGYDISSWTSTNYGVLYNHEDSAQSLYFVYVTDPSDPTTDEFCVVPPGQFAVIPNISPAASTLGGVADVSILVSVFDWTIVGDDATFDLYVTGS